jgi:hypothetical protein
VKRCCTAADRCRDSSARHATRHGRPTSRPLHTAEPRHGIPVAFRKRRLSSLHVTTTPRTPSPQWQPQQGSPVFAVLGGSSGAGIVLAILNEHLPQEVAPKKTNLLQARKMQFGSPMKRSIEAIALHRGLCSVCKSSNSLRSTSRRLQQSTVGPSTSRLELTRL